jgi:hypothetical protein
VNQKELNELGDLINERRELEVWFKENVAKLDEKIAAKVGKLQPEKPPDKPVKVEEFTRNRPGRPRKISQPITGDITGDFAPAPQGDQPATIDPAYMQPEPAG